MLNLATVAAKATPVLLAASTGGTVLSKVVKLLTGGIGFLGGAMVVWGAVSVGINVHNGASGNGSAIASGIGTAVGGVIIAAAAMYFSTLPLDWVG